MVTTSHYEVSSSTIPGIPRNLTLLPYVPDLAEYAVQVRSEITRRQKSDFIIAVDLPRGLENQVLAASKCLPEVSIVLDELNRAIPILPTSAPIEAVRSFQEYGFDLNFIDASLPVTGSTAEYQAFIRLCQQFGAANVVRNPDLYGLPAKEIFSSWLSTWVDQKVTPVYAHSPVITGSACIPGYHPDEASPYFRTRLQCMSGNVRKLLDEGTEVLLVCAQNHVAGILHYLGQDLPDIDDSFHVPARRCSIKQDDVLGITLEVPYFMYLYNLYRDEVLNREQWIREMYADATEGKSFPDKVRSILKYAYNLALADSDIFPDFYNLVASAKFVVDDDYAIKVHDKARSYPPNEDTISDFRVKKMYDYNFIPLGNQRSLTLKSKILDPDKRRNDWVRGSESSPKKGSYTRFTRTDESLQNEREFMKYMTTRFTAYQPSKENCDPHRFACGLSEGIDIRETLRQGYPRKLYIREPVREMCACYIMDYRDEQEIASQEDLWYYGAFFFDKNYEWIGIGDHSGNSEGFSFEFVQSWFAASQSFFSRSFPERFMAQLCSLNSLNHRRGSRSFRPDRDRASDSALAACSTRAGQRRSVPPAL